MFPSLLFPRLFYGYTGERATACALDCNARRDISATSCKLWGQMLCFDGRGIKCSNRVFVTLRNNSATCCYVLPGFPGGVHYIITNGESSGIMYSVSYSTWSKIALHNDSDDLINVMGVGIFL